MAWVRTVLLAAVLALVAGGEAQARWLRAETKHFVLYSDGGERALRDFATKIEVFDEALRLFHPVRDAAPPAKLDIYLVKDHRELERIWPRSGAVVGFYHAGPHGTFAVAQRDGGDFADHVLFHEYTHHFMLRYFAYPYPAWLIEGYAEYFGSSAVRPDRIEVGVPNNERGSSLDSWWLNSRDLFGEEKNRRQYWDLFYARAWLLTHFMMGDDARRRQLDAYMRMVGEGGDPMDSLEKVLGYDFATLDRNLRDYMKRRLPYTSIKRQDVDVPMTVTEMPPDADDVILERLRLLSGVGRKDAADVLKTIEFRTRGHEHDRLAQLTLARAHIVLGDPAEAEPILAPYLKDETDAEAMLLMGMRYARMADRLLYPQDEAEEDDEDDEEEDVSPPAILSATTQAEAADWFARAKPWFVKANHADPESYEALYAYARARSMDRDYPTDDILDILAAAYDRAPQVSEIAMTDAVALMARRRYDEAALLLEVLANNPHGGGTARSAQAMLREIERRRTAAGDTAGAPG